MGCWMAGETPRQDESEPKYDPKHLAKLIQGAEAWNAWRRIHRSIVPNLEAVDLSGKSLENIYLAHANLERANLSNANLSGAILSYANLKGAKLSKAKANGAILVSTKLQGADLRSASFIGARLSFAELENAHLGAANFEGADLLHVELAKATLFRTNLRGASLRSANLGGIDLIAINMEGADLRNIRGLKLNRTFIRDARFSPRSPDLWSVLRRGYTGPKLIFNLLFLIAFLVPYVLKTAGWVGVNRVQGELDTMVTDLRTSAANLPENERLKADSLEWAISKIDQRLPSNNPENWQESRVWRLVVGMDRGWLALLTALSLIAYNICRAILTWFVAPMRDEEERSGHTPAYDRRVQKAPDDRAPRNKFLKRLYERSKLVKTLFDFWEWLCRWWNSWFEAYGWLRGLHYVTKSFFIIAILSFTYHAIYWLSLPVWIPAN